MTVHGDAKSSIRNMITKALHKANAIIKHGPLRKLKYTGGQRYLENRLRVGKENKRLRIIRSKKRIEPFRKGAAKRSQKKVTLPTFNLPK